MSVSECLVVRRCDPYEAVRGASYQTNMAFAEKEPCLRKEKSF